MRDKFLKGLRLFNEGLFFEAHEAWEEAWNEAEGTEKRFLQALIQVAVALLKWQSDIPAGAFKMYKAATEKLAALPDRCLGMNVRAVEKDFKTALEDIAAGKTGIPFPKAGVFRLSVPIN